MMPNRWLQAVIVAAMFMPAVRAAEPGAILVPQTVQSLQGCWLGEGMVLGKQTIIKLIARPILQDAMFAIDVDSVAKQDAKDRYSAYLLFGGAAPKSGESREGISGFLADSFGGAFTATGTGTVEVDGFDMNYQYPGQVYMNKWRILADGITWKVVSRNAAGKEKLFAQYQLQRTRCQRAK